MDDLRQKYDPTVNTVAAAFEAALTDKQSRPQNTAARVVTAAEIEHWRHKTWHKADTAEKSAVLTCSKVSFANCCVDLSALINTFCPRSADGRLAFC